MRLRLVQRDLITVSLAALLFAAAAPQLASAQGPIGEPIYVSERPADGSFALAGPGKAAVISLSPGEFPGVTRAAKSFASDVERVTGTAPTVSTNLPNGRADVIIGTLGKNPAIDRLVAEHKLDASRLRGTWETFVTEIVEHPIAGVDRALVIAGSDKRGTIYGIYDLSSQIGVSPWTWWADVPVRHRASLYVLPGVHSLGEPAVKYRGIFLNDEAPALSGFVKEKFGGYNHQFYEHVFELVLRLKGNYLWPAMWGSAFNDDDKLNPVLADEYGVVMGTSHHEPMLRAQQEWKRYGHGEWNYEHNDSTLRAFWTQGIRNMDSHESIVTIGMRGDGDMPMTEGSNVALLERIVADQRTIISQVTGKPASQTPQLWALYKEVQDYYDKGMRVPDDVTLLFSDDNWGNIRRLPVGKDTLRSGGFGIYYHFDYVGGPRNYKWLNTNPIARVWEQMHLACSYGARTIWIVNVGDLKPMEFPISFFLDYAYAPERWTADKLREYTQGWAAQQFGPEHAADIADIITTSLKYAGRRKPELVDTSTYSLANFNEAETVRADYLALRDRAERIGKLLPADAQDAYYELVLHDVQAMANLYDLYVTVAKNRMYAAQGRAAANLLADSARALFAHDAEISAHYNTKVAGGKWPHMMDQAHIGYTYWQEPPRNVMPRVDVIQVPHVADMGVAIVEQNRAPPVGRRGGPGSPPPGFAGFRAPELPAFDPYQRQTYHLDIFAKGDVPFDYTVDAGQPWLVVSPARGRVTTEQRIAVSVDWNRAPSGTQHVPITVSGPNGSRVVIQAVIENPASPSRESVTGFVEGGGYVSIEAEHYTRAVNAAPVTWERIPDLGRTLSGMTVTPVTSTSRAPGGESPRLEYRMFLFDSGTVKVHAYLSPTLNFTGSKDGQRYAVSFDDEPPQIVNAQADTSNRAWEKMVADNVNIVVTQHTIAHPGEHVLKFWMVDPGVVLQKLVVEARDLPRTYLGPPESFHSAPDKTARFDWFDYRGNDSVYKTVAHDTKHYLNPIVAGFYPDPSIVRVGSDYYLTMSSFAYFPGLPVFHSKDLVNWTQIGSALDRPSQLNLDSAGISRGLFAPTIRYHDGTYYIICTLIDRGGNFIVTAKNPAGPWSDPVWLKELDGIDPSLFFDDDGKAYVINNGPPIGKPLYEGHRAIWIQEFDIKSMSLVGPRQVIVNGGVDLSKKPIWIEAPHILRVNGMYYLIAAEGGTAMQHSEVVFRSASVRGPYVPYDRNPILTQRHLDPSRPFPITSTGHADFVQTERGDWWAVFLGTRPYGDDLYNTGRETFLLPVHWENGWPLILGGRETVPYSAPRPQMVSIPAAAIPTAGNFTIHEEFEAPTLAHYWMFIRTPRERWYDLASARGQLSIRARHESLGGLGQPSFIGRRQQHTNASASTMMRFAPSDEGDRAGLTAFHNETHYYLLALAKRGGRTVIELERRAGAGDSTIVASVPVTLAADAPVYFRIDARGGLYDFYYALRPNEWIAIQRDADGTILSTKKAGGFVGTLFGLYAYSATP